MERYLEILQVALEAVFANRSRSILTALGIIFGVAAVIAMMAIGNGAQQEILDQMKMVGVNNIVVQARYEKNGSGDDDTEESGVQQQRKQYSPGLTLLDAEGIKEVIPTVKRVSPEVSYETSIIKDGIRQQAKLNGVQPDFFEVFNLTITSGNMFTADQLESGSPVCIIGPAIKSKFFALEDPIGKHIKCGNIWLKVIGVLENRLASLQSSQDLGISDFNNNIYAPIQTVLLRFKDRARINEGSLSNGNQTVIYSGNSVMSFSSSSSSEDDANYHQLDRIVVQVDESANLTSTTQILTKMLNRRHLGVEDFQITVPELLLKQEQRTKDIFNIVLGAIAGISLLVGGIGIMNIMLASVMERIREIGVRRSVGATKRDIIFQFLSEAILISISGGLFGILLGVIMARTIMETTDILTIVSAGSIMISFGVAATVGIVFGYLPARKAAQQDPVTSLRHD
ncbi:MAG: ABC transporter permease [Bacteroidales bacterium]|nr:ABC transporter permease [Bacteroidales bacterium]HOI31614.1 ABC transporter permease [Bacteroidales bacterium]